MQRRDFLMLAAGAARAAVAPGFRLIAHRGGVVDGHRPENSAAAIQEAIARGYWMIEVDVRRTRDGEPVLHHDATLEQYYGDPRRPEELSWNELKSLRAEPGGRHPIHFDEACGLCSGKMRLMLDLKGTGWPAAFYQGLWRSIESNRVPGPVYSLGGPSVKPLFEGRVMVSANRGVLRAAADQGQPLAREYFLFELASDLDAEAVALCRQLKVTPVAAVNTFRYTMAKRDEWKGPAKDVAALRKLGVRDFQVDSIYEPLFE